MKKLIALLCALALALSLAACSGSDTDQTSTDGSQNSSTTPTAVASSGSADTGMKEKLDQLQYAAYQDVFYNDNAEDYADKEYSTDGVFGIIYDAFNSVTRYYVWGYADTTKCCDWQWELKFPDGYTVPESGSYVDVSGIMTASADALDGYWLTDVDMTVEEEFAHAGYDYDMTTISPTLARVQIINMQNYTDIFGGKTLRVFGRAMGTNTVQHPYYDNAWSMDFTSLDGITVATGSDMVLTGTFEASGEGSVVNTESITIVD